MVPIVDEWNFRDIRMLTEISRENRRIKIKEGNVRWMFRLGGFYVKRD